MNTNDTTIRHVLTDDNWVSLKDVFGPDVRITVKNIGGTPVSIYTTNDLNLIVDDNYISENNIDPVEIGGLVYEISTSNDTEMMWAKALTGHAELAMRVFGTIDPDGDLSSAVNQFNEAFNQLNNDLNNHKNDKNNPHEVTKKQLGLGNIPDDVTIQDDPNVLDPNGLASSKAVNELNKKINEHTKDTNNPHKVTKEQVGLGLVQNYGIASSDDAKNELCNNKYMTPETTLITIKHYAELAYSVSPQQVIDGLIYDRPNGWSYDDMTSQSKIVEKIGDLTIKLNKDTQVCYAFDGRSTLSYPLENAIEYSFPYDSDLGIHYVYCDIDENKNIIAINNTTIEPYESHIRSHDTGDFFNVSKCIMYNEALEKIRRVYIAKVIIGLENNQRKIINTIPVPIGNLAMIPLLGIHPELGDSVIIDNPFISPTDVYAQIKYNGVWGETGWNDQMGVLAYPTPSNMNGRITIQFGLMGFAASSSSAGNTLDIPESIVTADDLEFRVVVTKKYR